MAKGIFKNSMWVSFATFLSRILGLFRDTLLAATLGGGFVMGAWTYAQMVPNLFRRLLGEGALGSALVPMITQTLETQDRKKADKDFSTVVIWLFFLLALITVVFSAAALLIYPFFTELRWKYALLTIPVIMPYSIMICLIGVFSSLLNALKIFFRPAIASLSLNISLIIALILVCPHFLNEPLKLLYTLSVAVLISGLSALIYLSILLKQQGLFPVFSIENLRNKSALKEIIRLTLPGVLGAGALEVGSFLDQTLSLLISDSATAAIYYSNRLVYLPIGVFAVAFGSVSLPYLSSLVVEKKIKSMLIQIFRTMRQLLFITIPMGMFLIFFGMDAIEIVFKRGRFDAAALEEAYQAFIYLTIGIPAFAAMKLSVTGFYSRKEMKTPAIVAVICLVLNFILSVALMRSMRQGGLTLATSITSYLNNIILLLILKKTFGRMPLFSTFKYFVLIVIIAFIAVTPAVYLSSWLDQIDFCLPHWIPKALPSFIGAGCIFSLTYMLLSSVLQIKEAQIVFKKLLRRR